MNTPELHKLSKEPVTFPVFVQVIVQATDGTYLLKQQRGKSTFLFTKLDLKRQDPRKQAQQLVESTLHQKSGRPVFLGSVHTIEARWGRATSLYYQAPLLDPLGKESSKGLRAISANDIRLGDFPLHQCFLLDYILGETPFVFTFHFDQKRRLCYVAEGDRRHQKVLYGCPMPDG